VKAYNFTATVTDAAGATASKNFALTIGTPPTLTAVNPPSLGQGAGPQNVIITGTGFQVGATVGFSGSGITLNGPAIRNSATQLTVNVTIAANAPTGLRDVTVTNVDTGTVTRTGGFIVGPAVFTILPASQPNNTNGDNETITGTGFQPGATVTFVGSNAPTVSGSVTVNGAGTQLTFQIDVPKKAKNNSYNVVVTNPDGGIGTLANGFSAT
jgi:hypothetical protein